jgi:hypothetical protein
LRLLDHLPNHCFGNITGQSLHLLHRIHHSYVSLADPQIIVYDSLHSSVTIVAGSLQLNQTYQFAVQMIDKRNSSTQATGFVLVTIEDDKPQLIAIG